MTFKPATLVKQLRAQEPSRSRQALARAAKSLLAEEDTDRRSEHLHSLPAQGLMSRCWGQKSPQLWVVAVEGLPPEPLSQCRAGYSVHKQQSLQMGEEVT